MQNCAVSGCHDVNAASGYDFTLYSTVSGNAELMLSSMRHETGTTPMPLGNNKLADSLIGKFSCWIAQGKQNN